MHTHELGGRGREEAEEVLPPTPKEGVTAALPASVFFVGACRLPDVRRSCPALGEREIPFSSPESKERVF